MIGADIVVPPMWSFCGSKNSARSAARKLVTLLLLAFQKTVPETKPEVVRFAGQSGALQLPKGASC